MQNALKLVPSYWDVTRNIEQTSVTPDLLSEYKEKDPEIKTIRGTDYMMNEYISIFTWILQQAISKRATSPVQILTCDFDARHDREQILDEQRYFQHVMDEFPESDQKTLIIFSRIKRSTFGTGTYTEIRNNFGTVNKELDKMFSKLTGETILGATKYENKPWVILHIKPNSYLKTIGQIFAMLIAQTMLGLDIETYPEKEKKLFKDLREQLYTLPGDVPFSDMTSDLQGNLQKLIIEYTKGLPEYTIDQQYQMECLIRSLKKRQYQDMETRMYSAQNKMQAALTRFQEANEAYQSFLQKYNAMKYYADQDNSLNEKVKELLDILNNYKCINFYQLVTNQGIQFKVVQPMHINSKEDWCNIESHAIRDEAMRKLLHETFIDEKYDIITEAGMMLDLTTFTIYRNPVFEREHGIPHPHIMRYNCFGTYQNLINDELVEANYAGALEEAIEAASGLNWADAPVISAMVEELNIGSFTHKIFVNKETKETFSYADYKGAYYNEINK